MMMRTCRSSTRLLRNINNGQFPRKGHALHNQTLFGDRIHGVDRFCPFGQCRQTHTRGNGISNCMASLDLEIADEQGLELRQAVAASLTDLTRKIMITAMVALVMDMECPFQGSVMA